MRPASVPTRRPNDRLGRRGGLALTKCLRPFGRAGNRPGEGRVPNGPTAAALCYTASTLCVIMPSATGEYGHVPMGGPQFTSMRACSALTLLPSPTPSSPPHAGETPQEFAARVQAMIAKYANLRIVPWDGYLKYYNLGEKNPGLIDKRRRVLADVLRGYLGKQPEPGAAGANAAEKQAVAGAGKGSKAGQQQQGAGEADGNTKKAQ